MDDNINDVLDYILMKIFRGHIGSDCYNFDNILHEIQYEDIERNLREINTKKCFMAPSHDNFDDFDII